VEESIRMTEDRDKWRKYVHGVANPRIKDGYRTGTRLWEPERASNEGFGSRRGTKRHRNNLRHTHNNNMK